MQASEGHEGGLDQNSCPRGGYLEKVCNRKQKNTRNLMGIRLICPKVGH